MKSNQWWLLAGMLFATAWAAGCDEDDKTCGKNSASYCSEDGTQRMVCLHHEWSAFQCDTGSVCSYVDGAATCVVKTPAAPATCGTERALCEGDSMVKTCRADGTWAFEVCGDKQICQDGQCVADPSIKPGTDNQGLVSRTCNTARDGVIDTFGDGTTSIHPCLELVGFAAECRENSQGLAGCYLPGTCDDTFTETGTCLDNRRLWCDGELYLTPVPVIDDCGATGRVCASVHGKTGCFESCTVGETPACVTSETGEMATLCVASESGDGVRVAATTLCLNASHSISCLDGKTVVTACDSGESCISATGACAETCTTENEVKLADSGDIMVCQKTGDGLAFVSEGKRYCQGDDFYMSSQDDSGVHTLKKIDCSRYEHTDGKIYNARCAAYYSYVPDSEMCIVRYEGDPCKSADHEVTEGGECNGSQLSYCATADDVILTSSCAANQDGFTTCSVYSGYADCRRPCTTSGHATCALDTSGESYTLALCAPDDVYPSVLSVIQGTSICLGDTLYTCDETGKAVTQDCAAMGGRCETNACIYPACATTPVCTAEDELLTCTLQSDGRVTGTQRQAASCQGDTCTYCEQGELKTMPYAR